MDTLAPELAQQWSANMMAATADKWKRDEDARAEEVELKRLAERVSAARSVV